ncbi:MAG: triose-phosphate isomerase [Deltaproteobacteria bacterium]|nr:MAG: triose-phosphate isomerase [Deltaproteobacteria bacterium]
MTRRAMMAGNWKMHMNAADGCKLAAAVAESAKNAADRDVLIAPPYTILSKVAEVLEGSAVILASQNICWEEKGAYTGEISPAMLKEAGGSAAIIGHSERRHIFGESDELINTRIKGALHHGLMAILCVGETLEERETGKTMEVLEQQVRTGLAGVDLEAMEKVVIAYEPVWAIGTGKTAGSGQAQEAHKFIRQLIEKMFEKKIAEATRILYGGSVKPTNVDELMAQPDVDGALVGGAALDSESFDRIINFR